MPPEGHPAGRRPTLRDWAHVLLASSLLGGVVLGVGGRVAMRGIALAQSLPPGFSWGGSLTVVFLGALSGLAIGGIFLAARALLPGRRWARGTLFWAVVMAIAFRGIRPPTALTIAWFLPLVVVHCAVLQWYWCRVLRRRRHGGEAGVAPASPGPDQLFANA